MEFEERKGKERKIMIFYLVWFQVLGGRKRFHGEISEKNVTRVSIKAFNIKLETFWSLKIA